jgi:hypothetical protein
MADRDIKPPSLATNQPVGGNSSNDIEHQRGGGQRHNPRQHWNQGAHHGSGKFKGKTKEVETDTFDNTGSHDAATFSKSLKKSGELIPVSEINRYLWKQAHTKVSERKEKYDKNMAKAYIIIYHQCSPNLKNDLEASDLFPSVRQNQDVIELLCLIQGLCFSYDA